MSYDIRYFAPDSLVEVTTVTLGNNFLMRPSPTLNRIVLGVFGKAQRKYDMKVCDLKVMSSHYHLLVVPRDPKQLGLVFHRLLVGPERLSHHLAPGFGGVAEIERQQRVEQAGVHLERTHRIHRRCVLDLVDLTREGYFIPEGTPLTTQLINFRKNKRRIGFVVDEYGDIQVWSPLKTFSRK